MNTILTSSAFAGEGNLQPPVMSSGARRFLAERGWNALLSWASENAPEHVFDLAQALNTLGYAAMVELENGGIDEDLNRSLLAQTGQLLNSLEQLGQL